MFKRSPLVSFFVLTYLLTWPFHILGFILMTRAGGAISNEDGFRHFTDLLTLRISAERLVAYLIYNLGQFGPLLAAFLVTAAVYGPEGVRDLRARVFRWRVAPRWYGIMLLLPLVMVVVSLAAAWLTGGFTLGPFTPRVAWLAFVPFLLYMIVFTGLAEEPGWRGFALPHLQATTSAYRASWILGVLWGVWHFPFTIYFNRDQPGLLIGSLLGLTLGIVGWTIVNTWLYNSTESVWLLILLHGWNNTVQSYLILAQPNFLAQTLYALVPWAIAVLLERRYGQADLAPAPRPKWWPGRYPVEQRGEAPPATDAARAGAIQP